MTDKSDTVRMIENDIIKQKIFIVIPLFSDGLSTWTWSESLKKSSYQFFDVDSENIYYISTDYKTARGI